MSRNSQIQILLLVMILGFFAGPHVLNALQYSAPTPQSSNALKNNHLSQIATDTISSIAPKENLPPPPEVNNDPYGNIFLRAKSVYVWDISSHRKLYSVNEKEQMPLASITKIMTALVAREILPQDAIATISQEDLAEEGDNGLLAGEKWLISDLIRFTLVTSSNDGASAIARTAGLYLRKDASLSAENAKKYFIDKMNEKARIIGLDNTYYLNTNGLDVSLEQNGAYGSARDMAMLFEYILRKYPDIFDATTYSDMSIVSLSNIEHHITNTNISVAKTTGIIASKTGYTDIAGGNLVVIVDIGVNQPVVIAVLGSTREERFSDVDKLIKATVKKVINGPIAFL